MPEHDPEQELGPKIASAFQSQADAQTGLRNGGLAREARRRVRKRRQNLTMAAAAVVVAAAIGGVWNLASGESPVASTAGDSSGKSQASAPDGAAARAESDAVWALCSTLPDRQRAAVVLRFYEELSYAEIGVLLHCAEATARSHVHRALAALKTTLSKEGAEDA